MKIVHFAQETVTLTGLRLLDFVSIAPYARKPAEQTAPELPDGVAAVQRCEPHGQPCTSGKNPVSAVQEAVGQFSFPAVLFAVVSAKIIGSAVRLTAKKFPNKNLPGFFLNFKTRAHIILSWLLLLNIFHLF